MVPDSLDRRALLIALGGVLPAVAVLSSSAAQTGSEDAFLRVSRLIAGSDRLSPDIARRIEGLLARRIAGFAGRLDDLAAAMRRTGGSRDEMLAALSPPQVELAVEIAKPWYLGYVGDPSATILKDDAVFATFLEAQSFDKIVDVVPRPTYPNHDAGWWSTPPPGVAAPPMPAEIVDWTFNPPGAGAIAAADPRWLHYAATPFDTIEDAEAAKPG